MENKVKKILNLVKKDEVVIPGFWYLVTTDIKVLRFFQNTGNCIDGFNKFDTTIIHSSMFSITCIFEGNPSKEGVYAIEFSKDYINYRLESKIENQY